MSKTIVELAREMSPMFEWRKREDGSDYVCLKDERPEGFPGMNGGLNIQAVQQYGGL